ncbi:MAG: NADH-quinone oxidoreductase subunit NuoH [Myxococcales bacterium]|nr:NADH-quinone oxidoreductase subunit NuoH [Myxococcales bacterium]
MGMDFVMNHVWLRPLFMSVLVVTAVMTTCAWSIWFERKLSARMQNRLGPTIVGPAGLLQPLADALKMLRKEILIPRDADPWLFRLAPPLVLFCTVAALAVVPWSETIYIADLDVGILWVLALAGLMLLPIWIAGWASNNKYALFGGMRAVAQGISYEIPLLLSAMVPVILAGSLNLKDIVRFQHDHGWFVLWPPGIGLVAFVVFFVTSLAEANRIPFDVPEAESELIAGISVEYTAMNLGLFPMAEYVHTLISSAVAATLFLGGWDGPFFDATWYDGVVWMVLKTGVLFVFIYVLRWSLVRFRSDQLMYACWVWLLPLALGLVGAAAVWVKLTQGQG